MLDRHVICLATTGNKSRPPCFTDQESDLQKDEGSQPVAGLGWNPKSAGLPNPKPHMVCPLGSHAKSYCSSM